MNDAPERILSLPQILLDRPTHHLEQYRRWVQKLKHFYQFNVERNYQPSVDPR